MHFRLAGQRFRLRLHPAASLRLHTRSHRRLGCRICANPLLRYAIDTCSIMAPAKPAVGGQSKWTKTHPAHGHRGRLDPVARDSQLYHHVPCLGAAHPHDPRRRGGHHQRCHRARVGASPQAVGKWRRGNLGCTIRPARRSLPRPPTHLR